eukprot:scaffold12360_cov109-Isochrysis_galbana.AAC.2
MRGSQGSPPPPPAPTSGERTGHSEPPPAPPSPRLHLPPPPAPATATRPPPLRAILSAAASCCTRPRLDWRETVPSRGCGGRQQPCWRLWKRQRGRTPPHATGQAHRAVRAHATGRQH